MKKAVKIIIIVVVVLAIIAAGVLLYINYYNSSHYIGKDAAKNIAAADAQLDLINVKFHHTDQEKENGVVYYDIEMVSGNTEYEYKIDAASGDILYKNTENAFD